MSVSLCKNYSRKILVWPIEACNFFWVFRPFYSVLAVFHAKKSKRDWKNMSAGLSFGLVFLGKQRIHQIVSPFRIYEYLLWFLFQLTNWGKKLVWTNKKMGYFNCSIWGKFMRKIRETNWWKHLMNSLKNCSRKILVWWCGQLKRVTFFPVSSCQLHVRKREEKKKKITALQLLCVCVCTLL